MNQVAATFSSYVSLPLAQIVESKTNPRRTFEPSKLVELAESITAHGLLQPITVRPLGKQYEIVAGARRFRAAQLAELEAIDARVMELSDEQALEAQIIENSQRQDVHPYEEAAGYDALLHRPGYDVAALAAKCGKSESHVYSRLSLLTLIPEVVEAFQQERITAAHANLLARLTPEQQTLAFPQCWVRFFQGGEPPLAPARTLNNWIRENLYLPLTEAPFDREDAALLPQAGSCPDCPKRTGYNQALFCDYSQDEQCLDSGCYQAKTDAHIERELAKDGQLLRIEASWRPEPERYPRSVSMRELWPLKEGGPACDSIEHGIIVYGNKAGTILPVCTQKACPVHNQHVREAAERRARAEAEEQEHRSRREAEAEARRAREEEEARNRPEPTEKELREAREQEEAEAEELRRIRAENEEHERRREEERQAYLQEAEAKHKQQEEQQKRRAAKLKRIAKAAPESLTTPQLRILLRAVLCSIYGTFLTPLAQEVLGEEDNRRDAREVLADHLAGLPDKQVSGFAVRLALGWVLEEPDGEEIDFLAEAEMVFVSKIAKKAAA